MNKSLSVLSILIFIAAIWSTLQGQDVHIQQAVSINNDGIAPRAGSVLDLGNSNKPLKIPAITQDSINEISPQEGMLAYNVDSARYEVNYAQYNQVDKGSSSVDMNTNVLLGNAGNVVFPTFKPGLNNTIDSISVYIKSCPQTLGTIFFDLYEVELGNCQNISIRATTNSLSTTSLSPFSWHTFSFSMPVDLRDDRHYTALISANTECVTTIATQASFTPNVGLLNATNCTFDDGNEANLIFHLKEKINLWSKLH